MKISVGILALLTMVSPCVMLIYNILETCGIVEPNNLVYIIGFLVFGIMGLVFFLISGAFDASEPLHGV